MWTTILTYLEGIKIWLFVIAISILSTAWLVDRHAEYNKGIASCQQQYAEAAAKYEQGQKKKDEQEKQQAVKEATDAANHINSLNAQKEIAEDKQRALNAKHPTTGCALSPDEFLLFNQTITNLQSGHYTNNVPARKSSKTR